MSIVFVKYFKNIHIIQFVVIHNMLILCFMSNALFYRSFVRFVRGRRSFVRFT
nr:MAG TPA: hypothetical protein [Caudoviricetes sp.]